MYGSMAAFAVRRLGASMLLILIVLTLTFFLIHLAPGDPSLLIDKPDVSPEYRQSMRAYWDLDKPIPVQYVLWLKSIIVRGDWGVSIEHRRPVAELLRDRIPATILLAGVGVILQYSLGLILGIAAARRVGARADHLLRAGSLMLYALPVFWTGLMALSLFSYRLHWLPGGLMHSIDAAQLGPAARILDLARHLILPSLVLAAAATGATVRFTRNSLLEVLGHDYIRTARAKGLTERRVVWVHALRNAATPLIQLVGLSLPFLLSGSLVVEVVFSWPGMGRLAWESVLSRDYPVILATTALSGILVVAGNLIADLSQAVLDPRVRE
jgi:peptide/nickel transport system permease protein